MPLSTARIAGALYLVSSVLFITAGSIRDRLIVSDPAATIENIRSSETLFRVGIATDVLSAALFLITAMALFALLGHVDQRMAGAMVVFAAVGAAIGCASIVSELSILSVATTSGYATLLGADGARGLVLLLAQTQRSTVLVSDLIAGLWLLPLGYLVIRSLFIPAAVGWLLLISGASWLALLFTDILLPGLGQVASYLPLGAVGEVAFMGWLLIKGAGAPSGTRSPRRPGTSAP